jgi:HEXXH motif-containing protein
MGRPILYIVFAYHAFGNVLLFYRMASTRGLTINEPGVDIDLQMESLENQLRQLEEALQTTKALTAIGKGLWEPLYELIHN